ncbi:DUF938 domain-containing protein [Novosphingopyxis sp. YJ-S2-01]|uniref:DUF938 domain-containing protein n=1 Tax=Novosphingopyxis sp. YJ-S2-01 TaxID=2794021 RepID=UPI001E559C26|nr:DUF938 domain-containing protein [Novosphingopyxis sp. YJ-S2-01]
MPEPGEAQGKQHAPATLRNRAAIAELLAEWLPETGRVLEVASGSGEHIVYFASHFPALRWQPSDPEPAAQRSIAAWTGEARLANVEPPIALDARAEHWDVARIDAVLCINMVHISPWEATEGLFAGAGRLLPPAAPLILYGPFLEADVETADSNLSFDASLKARDPRWGLRDLGEITALAQQYGFERPDRRAMPANNLMLRFVREA